MRPFLTNAAALEAAIRHEVGTPQRGPVDLDAAALNFAGETQSVRHIAREDTRTQPIFAIVCQRDCLVHRLDGRNGDCRAEQFVTRYAHLWLHVRDDSWRINRALALATRHDTRAVLHSFVDPRTDAHGFFLGDHGAEFRVFSQRIANFDRFDRALERVEEIVVNLAMDQHTLSRDTDLPGVDVTA